MAKLYELSEQYMRLMEQGIDTETGKPIDITDTQFKEALDVIIETIGDKTENLGKLFLSLSGDYRAVDNEIKRLKATKKRLKNKMEWIKEYLMYHLSLAEINKIERSLVKVRIVNNPPSVNVVDIKEVPELYLRTIPEQTKVIKLMVIGRYKKTKEETSGTKIQIKRRVEIK